MYNKNKDTPLAMVHYGKKGETTRWLSSSMCHRACSQSDSVSSYRYYIADEDINEDISYWIGWEISHDGCLRTEIPACQTAACLAQELDWKNLKKKMATDITVCQQILQFMVSYLCYFDNLRYVKIGCDRRHAFANEVCFISFLPVHEISILLRIYGYSSDSSLCTSSKDPDGDFSAVCNQEFLDFMPPGFSLGILVSWKELGTSMEETRVWTQTSCSGAVMLNDPFEVWNTDTEHCLALLNEISSHKLLPGNKNVLTKMLI